MKIGAVAVAMTVCLSLGCASIGPKKLVSSHEGYNDAVQLAITREVLTNIVRARYADPLRFLTVTSIAAQFSVGVSADASVGGIGGAAVSGVGGGIVAVIPGQAGIGTFSPRLDGRATASAASRRFVSAASSSPALTGSTTWRNG